MGLDQHFVVADAEPLIALSRLGELELLQQLLGEVWITSVVRQELLDAGSFQGQAAIAHALGEWLHETSVEIMDWRAIHPGIDPGKPAVFAWPSSIPKAFSLSMIERDGWRPKRGDCATLGCLA